LERYLKIGCDCFQTSSFFVATNELEHPKHMDFRQVRVNLEFFWSKVAESGIWLVSFDAWLLPFYIKKLCKSTNETSLEQLNFF